MGSRHGIGSVRRDSDHSGLGSKAVQERSGDIGVLIVDDKAIWRQTLSTSIRMILRKLGIPSDQVNISEAAEEQEAIDLLQSDTRISILICDGNLLEGTKGIGVVRVATELKEQRMLLRIMLSANNDLLSDVETERLVDLRIKKGGDFTDVLKDAIEEHLERLRSQ